VSGIVQDPGGMRAAHMTDQMVGVDRFLSAKGDAGIGDLIITGGDQDDVAVGCQRSAIRECPAVGGVRGPLAFFGMAVEEAADRNATAVQVAPESSGNFSGAYESDIHDSISGPERRI
jgi:hypothetical protein